MINSDFLDDLNTDGNTFYILNNKGQLKRFQYITRPGNDSGNISQFSQGKTQSRKKLEKLIEERNEGNRLFLLPQ